VVFNPNPRLLLSVIVLLFGGAAYFLLTHAPKLGLDLKGGTRLTMEAYPTADVKAITPKVMDSLHTTVERRVNRFGVSEALVQKSGDTRLIVEIPGVKDPEEAKRQLGKVGNLEFRELKGKDWVATGVSGKDLASAQLDTASNGGWIISFTLSEKGTEKFGELTQRLAPKHEPLGIFFDGKLVSSPAVNEPILQGSGIIQGKFTREEAKETVDLLNAGALPVEVKIIEENTVGPLLGQESIQKSYTAGLVGLGLVALFMLLMYRGRGLVADIALLFYTIVTLAAYVAMDVTFTLAGIAGFVLSIGMAVDANILIFERSKEELASGKSSQRAIDSGFERAFPSIFDSNMTTLITCALLWWLGSGPVKGFALTLAIGVAISMFSAITVTRTILKIVMGDNRSGSGMTFARG
jgi:preprotein translocase subunit SecD